MKHFLVAAALAALVPTAARAQSNCTASPSPCSPSSTNLRITITIGRAISMALSPGATALTVPAIADYNNGYALTTGPTITVNANTAWSVSIAAATTNWTATNTGSDPAWTNKPASDLQWSLTSGSGYVGLVSLPSTASIASIPTAGQGVSGTIYYRTNYSWLNDTAGKYQLDVVFTITSP